MEQLLARTEWFTTTIIPHEGALRSRLRRMVPTGFDLDDLVAEALTRAYASDSWATVTAGRAYLFQIARNLLVDAARRDKVVSFDVMADLDLLRVDDSTATGLEARDELRRVQAAIDTLPIQCRRVFVMRRVHELSVREIADRMGLSVSTVEKHLTKAVMRVAQAMTTGGEPDFARAAGRERDRVDRVRGSSARP